jgi:hypothetical protein
MNRDGLQVEKRIFIPRRRRESFPHTVEETSGERARSAGPPPPGDPMSCQCGRSERRHHVSLDQSALMIRASPLLICHLSTLCRFRTATT